MLFTHYDVSVTSKLAKYLINNHILLKYIEVVFCQLQMVKISCKLVFICVNYEKKEKKIYFLMKHRVQRRHGLNRACSRRLHWTRITQAL